MATASDQAKKDAEALQRAVNYDGYGFQYAVLDLAIKIQQESGWRVEAAEVPVASKGHDTRIDFVLRSNRLGECWMIAECKRADPARKKWYFLSAPFVHRQHKHGVHLHLEQVVLHTNIEFYAVGYNHLYTETERPFCSLGWELKSNEKGDRSGRRAIDENKKGDRSDRRTIDAAVNQALLCANGYVNYLHQCRRTLPEGLELFVVPVVFTTAELFACTTDLSEANISTGKIKINENELKKEPWIFYEAAVGPGIKHSQSYPDFPKTLMEAMDKEFIRTVPIVNASHIEDFLKAFLNQ